MASLVVVEHALRHHQLMVLVLYKVGRVHECNSGIAFFIQELKVT